MHISVTIDEAVSITGIGRTKLYEALKTGELQAKKLGKKTLILKDDLEDFLANLEPYNAVEGGKK